MASSKWEQKKVVIVLVLVVFHLRDFMQKEMPGNLGLDQLYKLLGILRLALQDL
jgi:hypothetical protein